MLAPRTLQVHASAELYGSDRSCLALASSIARQGWSASVLLPEDGPLVPALEAAGVRVFVEPSLVLRKADLRPGRLRSTLPAYASAARSLRRWSRGRSYDLVHSHCAPTLSGALLARWWDVPHVWQVHEIFSSALMCRAFEPMLCTADAVITASGAVREQFRSSRLRDGAYVAYSGADVPQGMTGVVPGRREVPEIVCVGRLNAGKGQDVLVDAVARVTAAGRRVHLTLVGSYYGREEHFRVRLEDQVARLGLGDAVTLVGERRDALEIVARSDIAVVPSRTPEPFGKVLVEAMALGRPVVASAAGGPLEVVTDGVDGLLVRPSDPDALAAALLRLLDDPAEAVRLGSAAVRRAADFPTRGMTDVIHRVHDSLLRPWPARPCAHPGA